MLRAKNQKGFTLIELVIVMAILVVLAAIAIPRTVWSIERGRITADQASVRTLNSVTALYRIDMVSADPFEDESKTNEELLEVLIDGGYLTSSVEPQIKVATFEWCFDRKQWLLMMEDSLHIIYTPDEHFTLHSSRAGEIVGYDGKAGEHLLIPSKIDDTYIKKILGQDGRGAFEGEDLESVLLPETLISIGNRAFLGNNLASIQLPDGIQEIGISAFSNNKITEIIIPDNVTVVGASAFHENPITKVVIGSGVSIGDSYSFGIHRPGGGGNFDQVYKSEDGGAGTYIWNGINWIKQGN